MYAPPPSVARFRGPPPPAPPAPHARAPRAAVRGYADEEDELLSANELVKTLQPPPRRAAPFGRADGGPRATVPPEYLAPARPWPGAAPPDI